jgi:hypothetical protein
MAFVKGDPRINRNGRPKNAESELLRDALRREGEKRGIPFWDVVAEHAFKDKIVMTAIVKKYVPDLNHNEVEAIVNVTQMPTVKLDENPTEINVGETPDGGS